MGAGRQTRAREEQPFREKSGPHGSRVPGLRQDPGSPRGGVPWGPRHPPALPIPAAAQRLVLSVPGPPSPQQRPSLPDTQPRTAPAGGFTPSPPSADRPPREHWPEMDTRRDPGRGRVLAIWPARCPGPPQLGRPYPRPRLGLCPRGAERAARCHRERGSRTRRRGTWGHGGLGGRALGLIPKFAVTQVRHFSDEKPYRASAVRWLFMP